MHIVLYEPDIPWNTGNIGRTCVATGSTLHLIGRLGFSLDDKEIRRSGLDYWDKLKVVQHETWEAFMESMPGSAPMFFFSKHAKADYWGASFQPNSYLVFGCETSGLPESIHRQFGERMFRIPMQEGAVRSLNLATSVGIVLYEAIRQTKSASVLQCFGARQTSGEAAPSVGRASVNRSTEAQKH